MSIEKFNPEDQLLCDYLMGELDLEQKRKVEAMLEGNPEARRELAELRETRQELEAALKSEAQNAAGLGPARLAGVEGDQAQGRSWYRSPWLLVAASLVAVVTTLSLTFLSKDKSPEIEDESAGGRVAEAPSQPWDSVGVPVVNDALMKDFDVEVAQGATITGGLPRTAAANPGTLAPSGAPAVVGLVVPGKFGRHDVPGQGGYRVQVQDNRRGRAETRYGLPASKDLRVNADVEELEFVPEEADALADKPMDMLERAGQKASSREALGELVLRLEKSGKARTPESLKAYRETVHRVAESLRRFNVGATTESYDTIVENDFLASTTNPLSTFSLDVDTASMANVRRFVEQGSAPPRNAVRIEELINYFHYNDEAPGVEDDHPVKVTTEVSRCFWNPNHKLVRIGVKAKDIPFENRARNNFVFLIDVSGSMDNPDKLPLLKKSFRLLVDTLGENDRIAIVVYASATGLVLPSTSGDNKDVILTALENLSAGGSTNGAGGIQLAYQTAIENFIKGGNNRVILATDGDFNVGVTDRGELIDLIEEKAKSDVFLSVLGFGRGNLKDSQMEQIADKGNGNYSYIDSVDEAKKVLVREMGGTLVTVAKDVKIQAEFNPATVGSYRLIGYENRILAARDFNDDTKDAGDMGAGHSVCALYEIVPAGEPQKKDVDELKYQTKRGLTDEALADELLTVKLRYKDPTASQSKLLTTTLKDNQLSFDEASEDLRWSAIVASFGMFLRDSAYRGTASLPLLLELGVTATGDDPHHDRRNFLTLMTKTAQTLLQQ